MPVADRKVWQLAQHGKVCRQCGVLDRYPNGSCKTCSLVKTARARKKNPHWRKLQGVKDRYGMTKGDKERIYLEQNRSCKFCRKPLPEVWNRNCQVEHDHLTGAIRGLVHPGCNRIIGVLDILRIDPELKILSEEYFK